ncbi:hypothetical protein [Sulfobacillus harzensis]|uniref:Uncharacterized protein n=1 Tax=Sulfobacillus harzensis TaxID=2729629 RepID=A0A7Y0Q469_9FIRM|nr:hypothetical protein [Sulfobacillus harzensis]NMP25023.1 hypothetical protein [Sulfobacillus harzensis]
MAKDHKAQDALDTAIRDGFHRYAARHGVTTVRFNEDRLHQRLAQKTPRFRGPRRRWGFAAAVVMVGMIAIGSGAWLHARVSSAVPRSIALPPPVATWNSTYWLHPPANVLSSVTVVSQQRATLVVQQSPDPAHPHGVTDTLDLTRTTTIWLNGHLVPYRTAPALHPGASITVVTAHQTHRITAQAIYGPQGQITGIITTVSHGMVTVREIKNLPHDRFTYSGQSARLVYNRRTNFGGATPADLLPGRMLEAQTFGDRGTRLMATLFVLRKGKRYGPGQYQWVQIQPHAKQ